MRKWLIAMFLFDGALSAHAWWNNGNGYNQYNPPVTTRPTVFGGVTPAVTWKLTTSDDAHDGP